MNINAIYILIAILIAVIAQATNTNLANNATFLLLLVLALGAYSQNHRNNNCCCNNFQSGFTNQTSF